MFYQNENEKFTQWQGSEVTFVGRQLDISCH